ncbi:HlyD family secretion protein [Pseudomonas sp. zbq_18]|uniref:HlyD family secretion protein n=1 Tax=Pseudomonadota TaxID=1224 RepID=UPI00370CF0D9
MKIRFSSSKEEKPTQDQGLQVLYAPGKRLAFKLRWYLILLAVTSPLLWLAGRALLSIWLIEAPAQLLLPGSELRAREPGQVQQILVKPGERVAAGQALIQMDNPEWRARLALLGTPDEPAELPADDALEVRERATLQRLLGSAEQRLSQLSALQAAGAATRGEVQAARDERDRRQRDLLQFDRQQRRVSVPDLGAQQRQLERVWLEGRLQGLTLVAPVTGVVSEVLVAEGENVGPGTLLLRQHRLDDVQLWIYLEPRDAGYAVPGQPLRIRMPDGSFLPAQVVRRVEDSIAIPAELQPAFSAPNRRLKVLARIQGDLPEHWRIDRLGLTARFPHRWPWVGAWLD